MSLDLNLLAAKLRRYREQLNVPLADVAAHTGIPLNRLKSFEDAETVPTGDEILMLADYYRCDYQFFISSERATVFEKTELLFRKHGNEFSRADRWAVLDFLYLCECEHDLLSERGQIKAKRLVLRNGSLTLKQQAERAAAALRKHLGWKFNELDPNIYDAIRKLGLHVFRRRLVNSTISGLFIKHPVAGGCILVNYNEDTFRQRFTAAHELAHAILDADEDFVVSFAAQSSQREVRANTFASRLLMPPPFLEALPDPRMWNRNKLLEWAQRMRVNPEPLCYALQQARLLRPAEVERLKKTKLPQELKLDPEVPANLSAGLQARLRDFLSRGLSRSYVKLCFEAYEHGEVSAGRLAEMLLTDETGLQEVAQLYGMRLAYAD